MSGLTQMGFHYVGGFSDAEVNTYFGTLSDCKPACITILGAAQYKEALDFAKRAKSAFPEMRVIFRHYRDGGDDGMWRRVSADEWWEKIGKLYINTGLTILSDNESTMEDYTLYAGWQARVMELAGALGVGIAYGRFPTHHVPAHRVSHLDAMLVAAFKFKKLHTFSPNIYWSLDNLDGFKYPYFVINYAQQKLGIDLDTTIGEFALLRDIKDAHHGWRSCNVSGKAFAYDAVIKAKVHLQGIPVCIYSIGQWPINADTFSLDSDALETIKHSLTPLKPRPVEIDPTPTHPLPAPETPTTPVPAPPVVIVPTPAPDTIALPRSYALSRLASVNQRRADVRAEIERRQAELAALDDEKEILELALNTQVAA